MAWDLNTYNALLVFTLLNLADIITTYNFVVKHGVGAEANPIARFFFKRMGVVGMFSFKALFTGGLLTILYLLLEDITSVLWIENIVLSGVIGWNSYVNSKRGRD